MSRTSTHHNYPLVLRKRIDYEVSIGSVCVDAGGRGDRFGVETLEPLSDELSYRLLVCLGHLSADPIGVHGLPAMMLRRLDPFSDVWDSIKEAAIVLFDHEYRHIIGTEQTISRRTEPER